jgi:hypothetical protein
LTLTMWSLINVLPMWFTIYKSPHLAYDPKRDDKFEPWIRHDFKNWSYLMAIPFSFLFWPRFLVCFGVIFSHIIVASLLDIGWDTTKPFYSGWRQIVFITHATYANRLWTLMNGNLWQTSR